MKITVIICTLVLFGSACEKGGAFCYKADGDLVVEERTHKDFTKISLDMEADLYVTQGEEYSLSIEASNNIMEIIETEVSGSILEIDLKKRKCIKNNSNVKVYVSVPTLKGLSISGSGEVFIPNAFSTNELALNISGSGSMEIDSLDVNYLETSISGSGNVYIYATDTVGNEKIDIRGSGEFRALSVPAKKVDVCVSGSGECEVYAIENLDVDISGSGDVTYKGSPVIDKRISGSGSINPY